MTLRLRLRLAALVVLACCAAPTACVFDSSGLALDAAPVPDLAPDRSVDFPIQPDLAPRDPCADAPSGNVCRERPGVDNDRTLQSGTCAGTSFVVSRTCFAIAPCGEDGVCRPESTLADCRAAACAGERSTCTAFLRVDGAGQATASYGCVKPLGTGLAAPGAPCASNEECQGTICAAGVCLQPCFKSFCAGGSGYCPCDGATTCRELSVSEGVYTADVTGCAPEPSDGGAPDAAGDGPPDSGTPDLPPDATPNATIDASLNDSEP